MPTAGLCSPKRRFWKAVRAFPNCFSKHFSTILCSPNEDLGRPNKHFRPRFRRTFQRFVLTPLKSASKTWSESYVNKSQLTCQCFILRTILCDASLRKHTNFAQSCVTHSTRNVWVLRSFPERCAVCHTSLWKFVSLVSGVMCNTGLCHVARHSGGLCCS